jgi:thiol-disulfide isomerase/thioredoxin
LEEKAKALYSEITGLMEKKEYDKAKKKMADLKAKYAATTTFKRARKLSKELEVIGKSAPVAWPIEKWYQGENAVDLNSGTTLLVFWEHWCPHCRREVPKLKETYAALSPQGLQVVGLTKITRSATEEKVLEFIKEEEVNYPMAKETGDLSTHFNVSGIPAAAVVKDGKIVWRGHPARLSEDMLKGWL